MHIVNVKTQRIRLYVRIAIQDEWYTEQLPFYKCKKIFLFIESSEKNYRSE